MLVGGSCGARTNPKRNAPVVKRSCWVSEANCEAATRPRASASRLSKRSAEAGDHAPNRACRRRELFAAKAGCVFWHLMQSTGRAVCAATRAWSTESEASALALFRKAGYGRERCQKTQPRESRRTNVFYRRKCALTNYIVGSGANSPCSGGGSEVLKLSVPVRSISRSPKRVNSR